MAETTRGAAGATLETLAGLTGAQLVGGRRAGELRVGDIGVNAQELPEGALFAALPGTRAHGASYAGQSRAAAVLTDEAGLGILREAGDPRPALVAVDVRDVLGTIAAEIHGRPSEGLTVIGITGTSGKTTTSYLVEKALMAAGKTVGLIGTTGTRIDGRAVPTKLTTPEATTLQALLARMRGEGVTYVVMEVSSHALAQRRVLGVDFAVAGFTNLSQDHLDYHPTMEDYFQAKALFFRPDSKLAARRAVVTVDDEWGERMAGIAGERAWRLSTRGAPADATARELGADDAGGQAFSLNVPGEELDRVELPLPGRFNVANAALALALVARVGVPLADAAPGIAKVSVPGRMERVDAGQDFLALVDYAHKPAAVAEVLDTLKGQVSGRIGIAVGAGGNRDSSKRPAMGREAAARADLVVVTDDNPRDEDPAAIRAAVLEGARQAAEDTGAELYEATDRRDAIETLAEWARPGDAIVVAGKGHETGQLVAGETLPFDDREELRRALANRAGGAADD
ncbi:UDP-N-acetylmuramoyl-L-alanyl-D-glutamate--2,6-diaminopimelate ligase [Corynebacterium otitidis]|uniref:UDP-N-acetylmuramoyl-L-alanyl-D-glutamate--2,6-diaminopimelate ligase n=1 Tax=Corynebacterium otitidis ATCC 51513 TaxID=883169 RepID=I7LBC9_9CORY|nr:UDP-N-acetylmuramoyl-L-alanyl-D-glutamate--2,6-diaminopimelate ligase [Corynebacterium otitidis]EJZ82768.1 UDP-N-acetylmuramyl-tripeptide synthetase [Corynebacterium otitidis ATCC 51513]CCI83009.1 UDP-N-acetylmuramoylalanyl-D-glutamate-2, 6-diaminopimelate ligase [Corynebacterium otitidis ATCC 51513]